MLGKGSSGSKGNVEHSRTRDLRAYGLIRNITKVRQGISAETVLIQNPGKDGLCVFYWQR